MVRWLILCVICCGATVGLVLIGSKLLEARQPAPPARTTPTKQQDALPGQVALPVSVPSTSPNSGEKPAIIFWGADDSNRGLEYFTITNGHIQSIDRIDLPAEHDGRVMFIATDKILPGTPQNKLFKEKRWVVAFKYKKDETPREDDHVIVEGAEKGAIYRRWQPSDGLPPERVRVGYVESIYRRLVEGDRVEEGDLVAMIDPKIACDEVESKLSKIDVALSELQTSAATKEEAKSRYDRNVQANIRYPGSVSPEELQGALLTWKRYQEEEKAKQANLIAAQKEANAAITMLNKHEIRAGVSGEIKTIYKYQNEGLKQYESVLQIQSPDHLRVETFLDAQMESKVSPGMQVTVEPTTMAAPVRILGGHLQTITGVAVGKAQKSAQGEEPRYTIVSASDDRTVIGWDLRTGQALWKMPQRSVVRAVACTGELAANNLVLLGANDGSGRLFDLNKIQANMEESLPLQARAEQLRIAIEKNEKPGELNNLKSERDKLLGRLEEIRARMAPVELEKHHQGAILCAAFSPDGTTCATSGDDRAIRLWSTTTGELKNSIEHAHRAPVTSLQFASNEELLSAGRDNDLNHWSVRANEPPHPIHSFEHRSGEVLQLGVSPDGKQVLFDQGKELVLLSLAKQKPDAAVQNYGGSANFSTLALFAPDGKSILTASSGENRLQLFRTPSDKDNPGELRQFRWNTGTTTCGAFTSNSRFAVTGTEDHQVLVWELPGKDEIEEPIKGTVVLIPKSLDNGSTHQKRIWVEVNMAGLKNPNRLQAGSVATVVVRPAPAKPAN
jgi:WD40 repeat protein